MFSSRRFELLCVALLSLLVLGLCAPTLGLTSLTRWYSAVGLDPIKMTMPLGLDLRGGLDLLYQFTPVENQSGPAPLAGRELATRARDVVASRLDVLGVVAASVSLQGDAHDRIRVQMPGADPVEHARVKEIVGSTSLLGFHEVLEVGPTVGDIESGGTESWILPEAPRSSSPAGPWQHETPRAWYRVRRTPEATGEHLTDVSVQPGLLGSPEIQFRIAPQAGPRFAALTERLRGRSLAVVLAGKVQTAPVIEGVFDEHARIVGKFDLEEARRITRLLSAGSLPVRLELIHESAIGPTLGAQAIEDGLRASVTSGGIAVLFLAGFYGRAGLFASAALVLNLLLQLAGMLVLGATLTLPGLAGLALGTAMAVDSNVLVFERIREETAQGKSPRAALAAGYDRAFGALLDSHATTIFTGIILAHFGTGPIRGFAIALVIGLVANLFTAVRVTRLLQDTFTPAASSR